MLQKLAIFIATWGKHAFYLPGSGDTFLPGILKALLGLFQALPQTHTDYGADIGQQHSSVFKLLKSLGFTMSKSF